MTYGGRYQEIDASSHGQRPPKCPLLAASAVAASHCIGDEDALCIVLIPSEVWWVLFQSLSNVRL